MPRQRMIQPGIWIDEGFLSLSIQARLLFIGMISGADDEGRGLATDRCLKARIFPADDDVTLSQIRNYRDEVAAAVNVTIYDVGGKTYYQCSKWRNHQRLEKPAASIIPPPPEASGSDTGKVPEQSGNVPAELKKEEKEEKERTTAPTRSTASVPKPFFNTSIRKWENITDDMIAMWEKAYPACDMERELTKMAVWILENPKKGHKSNWGRFITNWLSRSQDHGGTK